MVSPFVLACLTISISICVGPLIFLLFAALHIIRSYVKAFRLDRSLKDVPEPPISWLSRVTVGHNIILLLIVNTREAMSQQFNKWKTNYGGLYKVSLFLGEPTVIISSESAIRHVCLSNRSSIYHKAPILRDSLSSIVGNDGLLLAEGASHSRQKCIVAPTMKGDSLVSLSQVFLDQAQLLTAQLKTSAHSDRDAHVSTAGIFQLIQQSTFAVILDVSFGNKFIPEHLITSLRQDYFDCIAEPPKHHIRRYVLQRVFDFLPRHLFGYKEKLKQSIQQRISSLIEQHNKDVQYSGFKTDGGIASDKRVSKNVNLLSLTSNGLQNGRLSHQECVHLVMTFLSAGQFTTSLSIMWTLYNLAAHRLWQNRLRDELSTWDCCHGTTALDQLPLLHRIVKESLRLDPPVHYTSRILKEADIIDGHFLPAGVTLRLPIFAIQRDKSIWGPDAHIFNPDRWLDPAIQSKSIYFCTFWHGQRGCIGQRFAIIEIKAFVAVIIKALEVSTDLKKDSVPTARGPFSNPENMILQFDPVS